ncbi:undecaprenyl-phosphate glucose phosphotransferase [Duganella fentianensis]|uniref:undecaprenyl-phosphate glucose phosphotransferase n=1 Tax=Duganella fentianensis TaxID=2692177 RepID=UPI0032B10EEE
MTLNDIPLVPFFQRVLDPLIVMVSLYLCTVLFQEPFTGYYMILMILAFFIASGMDNYIDPYRTWRSGRMAAYVRDTVVSWSLTVVVLTLIGVTSGLGSAFNLDVLLCWAVATPVILLLSHEAVWRMSIGRIGRGEARSVIIIGANDVGLRFADICDNQPNLFMHMLGFFDDRTEDRHPPGRRHPIRGKMDKVSAFVREHNVKMIFISQPISAQPRIRRLLDELQDTTASVYFLPDIYVFDLMQARFDNVGGMPVIAICETPFTGINSMVKRTSDIILGSLILIMLLPIMLVIALVVRFTSPGPVIFRQRRYGLYGEEILVYKFRSMTTVDDGNTIVQARKDDQRVTPVGAFLRRTSLDELPQFFNVLQGRMSIVGPRPHAVAHNEQYRKLIKGYMLRHKVKPGITGWAQVNGMRGETDTLDKMEARIQYDLSYLRNWSLLLDLLIIIKTVSVVLKRENAH